MRKSPTGIEMRARQNANLKLKKEGLSRTQAREVIVRDVVTGRVDVDRSTENQNVDERDKRAGTVLTLLDESTEKVMKTISPEKIRTGRKRRGLA